jgi:hypothetical protein
VSRRGLFCQLVIRIVIGIDRDVLGVSQDKGVPLIPQVSVQSVVQFGLRTRPFDGRELITAKSLFSAVGTDDTGLVVAAACLRKHFIAIIINRGEEDHSPFRKSISGSPRLSTLTPPGARLCLTATILDVRFFIIYSKNFFSLYCCVRYNSFSLYSAVI